MPRKPSVLIWNRSAAQVSLLVAWRSTASDSSAAEIPQQHRAALQLLRRKRPALRPLAQQRDLPLPRVVHRGAMAELAADEGLQHKLLGLSLAAHQ